MGSGLKTQNMTGIRAQKGGITDHKALLTAFLNTLSTPEGTENDLYISFLQETRKKKKDKKKSCERERYISTSLTNLLLASLQA